MKQTHDDIKTELNEIKEQLKTMIEQQQEIKKEIHMIFADISHFEDLVLKILDSTHSSWAKEKYHH